MPPSKLKPITKATQNVALLSRTTFQVSRLLEETLFSEADVLSEGSMRTAGPGQATYFGSTMIRVRIAALLSRTRRLANRAERVALTTAIEGSARIRLRAMRLARVEAARRLDASSMGTALCEIRVRDTGDELHIDVDLEVPVRVSSRAKGS